MRQVHTISRGSKPSGILLLLCILSISSVSLSFGENSEPENSEPEWSTFSAEQKGNWLAEHREDPHFYDRLLDTAKAFEDPSRSKQILDRYLPLLDKPEERYEVLLMLAHLEESLGNYKDAQSHYQSAAFVRRGERDYKALFHSALLLIEQGEYSLAEVQLTRVRDSTDSEKLMRTAQLNLARLYALTGNTEEAEKTIAGIMEDETGPEIYYLIYTVSSHLEMDEQARAAGQRLIKEFPKSPEAQLVQGIAEEAPSTEKVFGLLLREETAESSKAASGEAQKETRGQPQQDEEQVKPQEEQKARGVQTGSFRDIENADYMAAELEKKGFSAQVEEKTVNGTKYHQVIVPVPEDLRAQNIMLRLKEEGFEGYPVY
ncbi:MAG: tetratricopeptide repeat protein [Spirochaetia bacterium]